MGLTEPGTYKRVTRSAYRLLELITYFTAGEKVRAWTIRKGLEAPQAASVDYTDFEKGFIRAEIDPLRRLYQIQI